MYVVKQSTALTVPFFAHDVNGDGVTGLVDGGFTKRISKGSGAWAAMTVTITEMENGWYSFPLSGTHSDTLGLLSISFSHGSTKRVNLQWRVEANLLDNLATPTNITAATGVVLSGVTHTGAVIPTVSAVTGLTAANLDATISSRMATYTQPTGFLAATFPAGTVANTTNITAGTIATVTTLTNLPAITANWLTATGINADAFTAAKFADDVSTEFANKVWDTDATGRQTQGTFGQAIGDPAADTNTIYKAVVTDATGATVGVDVVAVKAETAAILDDTDDIGVAGAGLTAINLPDQTMNITGDITGNLSGSVGSVTTVSDKTGYRLSATGVDDIWDEALTKATHDVANSSGKRLRLIDAAFEVHAGTCLGGTANTINLDAGASAASNIYNGDRIVITAGTGLGEHGLVIAYDGGTKIATMSKNWVTTPLTGDSEFEIVPADCDVESWNNTAVTGDGDWTELQTDVDAILVDTGTTLDARIPAALTGAGNIKADVLAINGNTTSAQVLAILNGATVVYQGTVTGAATTTSLVDTGLTQADADWWKGRIIIFTSVITMQATDILTFTPGTDTLTFTAVTTAPTGASYVII